MYLVPLWALFSAVRTRMGLALLSSKVWPSGLSGALLPWSSSFWRCQIGRTCTPSTGPGSRRRYWIVPLHQIQSPVWSLRKGCWTFTPFLNSGYASGWGGAGGRMMRTLGPGGMLVVVGGRMMRMLGPVFPGGLGGVRGAGRLLPCRPFWFAGGLGRMRLFSVLLAGWDWRWWGWGGVGLEERVRGLLVRIPQRELCWRLHGCSRVAVREAGELAYGLRGVGWPRQCGRVDVQGVVEVVVPHGLGLLDPGLRGFWRIWITGGSLSPVECCVEGFSRGAHVACEGGGLEESLPASWGVFRVYFWAVGLGRHEDSVCPVEDPTLGVCFEDVDGGLLEGCVQDVPRRGG